VCHSGPSWAASVMIFEFRARTGLDGVIGKCAPSPPGSYPLSMLWFTLCRLPQLDAVKRAEAKHSAGHLGSWTDSCATVLTMRRSRCLARRPAQRSQQQSGIQVPGHRLAAGRSAGSMVAAGLGLRWRAASPGCHQARRRLAGAAGEIARGCGPAYGGCRVLSRIAASGGQVRAVGLRGALGRGGAA